MVHGSGYTGSCVQGTAGGTEGWSDYTTRRDPDLRSGSVGPRTVWLRQVRDHEGESKIATNPLGATALIPTFGGSPARPGRLVRQYRAGWYRHHHWPDGPLWRAGTSVKWPARARSGPAVVTRRTPSRPTASNWAGSRWSLRPLGPSTKPSNRAREEGARGTGYHSSG